MKQTDAMLLGPGPTNPPVRAPVQGAAALCKTIGSTLERAMVEGRHTQESLAPRMGISRGYLNLIISGKRQANVTHILRAVRATGSLVPIQWICEQVGGALDWDEVDSELQQLEARADLLRSLKQSERVTVRGRR